MFSYSVFGKVRQPVADGLKLGPDVHDEPDGALQLVGGHGAGSGTNVAVLNLATEGATQTANLRY